MPQRTRWSVVAALMLAASVWPVAAQDGLTVMYNEKPPFFYTKDGMPAGILVDIMLKVADRSGVAIRFESVPFNRILQRLKVEEPGVAALGLSLTEERTAYAVFSLPLYKDSRPIILARASRKSGFTSYARMEDMVSSTNYTYGGVLGNVYPIDPLLATMGKRDRRWAVSPEQLMLMLTLGRFDFMMIYPEELEYLLATAGVAASDIAVLAYPDVPDGDYRYLLFSKSVPSDLVDRLNAAIAALQLP